MNWLPSRASGEDMLGEPQRTQSKEKIGATLESNVQAVHANTLKAKCGRSKAIAGDGSAVGETQGPSARVPEQGVELARRVCLLLDGRCQFLRLWSE